MVYTNAKIEEITEQVRFLYQSYSLWLELADPRENSKYKESIISHPDLVNVLAESLFCSMVITISSLCEKNKPEKKKEERVLSIFSVVESLVNIYPDLQSIASEILDPYEPEIKLLMKIRHKVYAHRDNSMCPEMIFKNADISPERIHSCISSILDVIDTINVTAIQKPKNSTTLEVLNSVHNVQSSLAKLLP